MSKRLLIFGLGYSAKVIAANAQDAGWLVRATGSDGDLDFGDKRAVKQAIDSASHIISSVPPVDDSDVVLDHYGQVLAGKWLGYLSSTGVYGDAQGAWVDEGTPTGSGRRTARAQADTRWLSLGARAFRLPGIYGPERSVFDRIASGRAKRIDMPGQVFSRVHVADIASGVVAAMQADAPPGAYNLGDDLPCSQNTLVEHACALTGQEPPPLISIEDADLSPMARGFYAENRRVANGKAKRILGWQPQFPTYREGLAALL